MALLKRADPQIVKAMKVKLFNTGPYRVNTYIAWDEKSKEAIIVDPGAFTSPMKVCIEDEGLHIKYIILTHGHADHIGGVEDALNANEGSLLVAGMMEKPLLSNPNLNVSREILGHPVVLFTDIAVKDGERLPLGDLELSFIYTPGHTKGGICIQVADKLFSGDTLFYESVGRADLPTGDYEKLIASIREKLFILPDTTTVFTGHGMSTTIGHEKERNPFV